MKTLRDKCIIGITANPERTRDMVLGSLGIVTLLSPILGYEQCSEIALEGSAHAKSIHQIAVLERKLLSQEQWDELFSLENLLNPK
jgi:aspartate ammonia-lyase